MQATIGGGVVLDVAPARRAADACVRLDLALGARVMAARPWCTVAELTPLAGTADADAFARDLVARGDAVRVGDWFVAPSALAHLRAAVLGQLRQRGGEAPLARVASACGVDAPRLRAALAGDPDVVVDRDVLRAATAAPLAADPAARAVLTALDASPFSPPSPAEIGADPAVVRALVRSDALVELDGVYFTAGALATARTLIADAVLSRGTVTVADIRDLLGSTRKYVIPIVNRMDAEGVTRRRGDERIAGPRAAGT
jgi:hypothetical protein